MNGLTLRTFERLARQNDSGIIALDKNDETQLVNNRGSLGRAIVSTFKDIGQALGIGDPTRARRQQDAFDQFKQLLSDRFGEQAATRALQQAGLGQGHRLRAGDVERVIQLAGRERHAVLMDQAARLEKFQPPLDGADPTGEFTQILGMLRPPLDLSDLSPQVRDEYVTRLAAACRSQGNLGVTPLDDGEMLELSRRTLRDVVGMEQRGQLDEARAVRNSLVQGWKDLLLAVSQGASPQVLMDRLEVIQQRTGLLLTCELAPGDDQGSDFFAECARTSLLGAMTQLRSEDGGPELLRGLLDRTLDEQGPLKAVNLAAMEQLYSLDPHRSPTNLQFAGRIHHDISVMVGVLSCAFSARGGSGGDNMGKLMEDDLPEPLRQAGTQAFDTVRQRQFDAPRNLLDAYVGQFDQPYEGGELPPWSSTQALVQFEQRVNEHIRRIECNPLEAIRDLQQALDLVDVPAPGLKERLVAALNAMEAGFQLEMELHEHPVFGSVDPGDLWRLFAAGDRQLSPGATKWELEQNGEGSLAAMQQAFLSMLNGLDRDTLDDKWLERLQVTGSRDTFRTFDLIVSYKPDLPEMDPTGEQAREFRNDARVPSGYRDGSTDLRLALDTETTPDGLEEMRLMAQGDPWFAGIRQTDTAFEIDLSGKTPQECRERARDILARHDRDIALAGTEEEKLRVIAHTVQDLYRSHVFMDGNTRTNVFCALNGLLMRAGLSPCILPEPKAAAGFSLGEFAREIRRGQEFFQGIRRT